MWCGERETEIGDVEAEGMCMFGGAASRAEAR
jgi:hypothetical protein